MKIFSRYMLREFLKVFLLTMLVFLAIYYIVDFLEKIDNFSEAGVTAARIGYFFLMMAPSVVMYMTPVAILVSLLISLGIMARNSEIVAFKAGGVSIFKLSVPLFMMSMVLSCVIFLLSDMVIPYTSAQVNQIWDIEVEKKGKAAPHIQYDVWYRSPDRVFHLGEYNKLTRTVSDFSIYFFEGDFRLIKRIEARSARFLNGEWELIDGVEKEYKSGRQLIVDRFDRKLVRLEDLPEEFAAVEKAAEEMSLAELGEWITRMRMEGYDPLKYLVDYHFKISFPFICAIMAIIGLPIAFWKEKGGGIALGVGVGIGLSFAYLVFLGLARSLGYSGALPPVAAAWLPNTIFSLLGFYLFTHVRQ